MELQQHVLVVPCPAQGHVTPLIKLAYNLAYQGIKVTFANSEYIEAKVLAVMSDADKEQCPVTLVAYSDGLDSHPEQRYGQGLMDGLKKYMPANLEKLIKQINHSDNKEPLTCVIADLTVGWSLEVARKMGIKQVAVWPAGPGCLALALRIPKLIKEGVIDENGMWTVIYVLDSVTDIVDLFLYVQFLQVQQFKMSSSVYQKKFLG